MTYYVILQNGYVAQMCSVSTDADGGITEEEYNRILSIIRNKPAAPDGYEYRLRADTLEWELAELPPAPDPMEEEIPAEEALAEIEEVLGYEA